MIKKSIFIFKILITLSLLPKSFGITHSKLILELYRHGSRTTEKNYLNQSYFDDLGPMALYANGMRQHLMLGRQIAQNYSRLLSGSQNVSYAITYSSSETRCILSAQSHNIGIYDLGIGSEITSNTPEAINPPSTITVPQPTDNYSLSQGYWPTQIITQMNRSEDTMFMPRGEGCPFLEKTVSEEISAQGDKYFEAIQNNVTLFYERLAGLGYGCKKILGKDSCNQSDLVMYYDIFNSYFGHEGKWPENITQALIDDLTPLASYGYLVQYSMKNFANVRTHKFAEAILYHLNQRKIDLDQGNDYYYRYVGFSGHETNLYPLLFAFNATTLDCVKEIILTGKTERENCFLIPDYASSIIVDFAQDSLTNDFKILISFNGIPLNFCSTPVDSKGYCDYNDVINLILERATEPNFNVRCKGIQTIESKKTLVYIIVICVLAFCLGTALAYIWLLSKRPQRVRIITQNSKLSRFSENSLTESDATGPMLPSKKGNKI